MFKYFKLVLASAVLLTIVFAGCTKYAKEEQLVNLQETKKAALAAENKLEQKKAERMEWEGKVAEKNADLKSTEDQHKEVSDKYRK